MLDDDNTAHAVAAGMHTLAMLPPAGRDDATRWPRRPGTTESPQNLTRGAEGLALATRLAHRCHGGRVGPSLLPALACAVAGDAVRRLRC